jgi:propionyl-CoA carboxylase beta chain
MASSGAMMPDPGSGTAFRIADLAARDEEALRISEKRAVDRQHAKGKLTARERIDLLVDPGSFVEMDRLARQRAAVQGDDSRPYGDGVITGQATVDGRPVCLFSQDFTVFGGSMGEVFGEKVLKVSDLALRIGVPLIGINDSGGARIQEGVVSLAYYAELGKRAAHASGVIPQISMIMGPCAGGAVYVPAITDFTVMVDDISHMFVTGPDIVAEVTGERVDHQQLGGADVNSEISGNAHHRAIDEKDAVDWVQTLLGFLPANNLDGAPVYAAATSSQVTDADLALDKLVPDEPGQSYDMYNLIYALVDEGHFLEVQKSFAPNMICGFGRIDGNSVGIVANQPLFLAGVIDINASEKAARFVRFCDAFGIPIVTLADVPGYLPGVEQERGGIIRRGAKLIYAYSEATVPTVTVVVRKAYGGGYAVMGSKHLGADVNLAWPTAEIAVMGAEAAVSILHRKVLRDLEGTRREAARAKLIQDYRDRYATPYAAADRGYVDRVIRPAATRIEVTTALRMLRNKRQVLPAKKHGNIPL